MKGYWKLLNLDKGTYSEHETEEEVLHIIKYHSRDLGDDYVSSHATIRTQYNNYQFEYITNYTSAAIHRFIYFYDTIEEEFDDAEDTISEMRNRITSLKNKIMHFDVDADEMQRKFDDAYEAMESVMKDENCRLQTRNKELEGKLICYAGEIERLSALLSKYVDFPPCCNDCVHCRPSKEEKGEVICGREGQIIPTPFKFYCKNFTPYEDSDDYPF